MKSTALTLALFSLLSVQAALAGKVAMRDNMHGARYGEIVVVTGGPFSFTGHVYNTLGLNNCPEAAWKALDPKKLKKQYDAEAVILNGPRYFLMDECSLANPGNIETFGTLQARHLADVKISLGSVLRGKAKPYTDNVVSRTTTYVYNKGTRIYELTSPTGQKYVMQTYALIVDPNLTEPQLKSLGSRLKLPKGWKFSTRTLASDLKLTASGTAYVLQDDLENSYQRVN